jgi:hypothetical protein
MNELPVPPDAARDPDATELLRAWVVDQSLYCILHAGAFDDPATWGLLLADVIHHLGDALAQAGHEPAQTIAVIRAALDRELDQAAPAAPKA